MKIKALTFLLTIASPALAQEAVLVTPVVQPSEAKHLVSNEKGFSVSASRVVINMEIRSSTATGSVLIREYVLEIPEGTATVGGFLTAINTVIPGEAGGIGRRMNARIVKFLATNSLLPPVNVNP